MSFNVTIFGKKQVVHRKLQLLIIQAQYAIQQVESLDRTEVEAILTGDAYIHPTRGLQATSANTVNGLEPDPADLPQTQTQVSGTKPGPKMVNEA